MNMSFYQMSNVDLSNHGSNVMAATLVRMIDEGIITQEVADEFMLTHEIVASSKNGIFAKFWSHITSKYKNPRPDAIYYVCVQHTKYEPKEQTEEKIE